MGKTELHGHGSAATTESLERSRGACARAAIF